MPKVSVVITFYNSKKYVESCLRSVTSQSERDLQIIAIDDGSTDSTPVLLRNLASADKRIEIYHQPHSGSPGLARNLGLSHACGRYIALLDGDDRYHPDRLAKALCVLETVKGVDILFHDFKRVQGWHVEPVSFLTQTRFIDRALAHLNFVMPNIYICSKDFYLFASLEFLPLRTCSVIIRTDSTVNSAFLQFREDMSNGEDGDFWLRLIKGRTLIFLDESLSYYEDRPDSLSSDPVRHLAGSIRLHRDNLKRGMDVFSEQQAAQYRSKIATMLAELGYLYFCRANIREARAAYRESMHSEPRMKTFASYLKTFVPHQAVTHYRRLRRDISNISDPESELGVQALDPGQDHQFNEHFR
jgi:glycosyltransferase involved in cell wall biosynthesis